MSNVATLLRQTRIKRQLTATEVAAASGVNLVTISQIEHDRLRGAASTLRAIGAALGIDEAVLFDAYLQDALVAAKRVWFENYEPHQEASGVTDMVRESYGIERSLGSLRNP